MYRNGRYFLRFWCHKILPLVYDDSLSYYEVLCKLRDAVENIIEDVATIEEVCGRYSVEYDDENHSATISYNSLVESEG